MTAIVSAKSNPGVTGSSSLTIETKAWLLCRFLCRDLTEENFEKVRAHVSSSCSKGVKTKVKLSPNGWRVGYKPSDVRHFNRNLPYETIPLESVESVFQDSTYVNVLLCVVRLQRNIPGIMRFEVTVYKFSDPDTTKRIQHIFQILTGSCDHNTTARFHPISSRPYPLRPLPFYGRYRHTAALPQDVHGKTGSQSTNESVPSSYREVAVTASRDRSPALSGNKAALRFHRYRTYLCDGVPVADVACQVTATEERPRGRSLDGSTSNGPPSSSGNWEDHDAGMMTSTVRRIYNRTRVRRAPEDPSDGHVTRTRPEHRLRSRSVEPLREGLRSVSVSRPGEVKSQPPPSQSPSCHLDGNFTKLYAPRAYQHVRYSGYGPSSAYQRNGSQGNGERYLESTRRY